MHAAGVICELNPFHNGHAYLLSRMREQVGADGCVVCLMSGRFVQRGTAAMGDPYLRARMAVAGGADLVLELPFPWSAGSAEHFATAGVRVLARLGVEGITFGSECGDRAQLTRAARATLHPAFGETYAALCRRGMGTTTAYAEAIRTVADGEGTPLPAGFPSSNDLLGIAYLRALEKLRTQADDRAGALPCPEATVIPRLGAGYREEVLTEGTYPSATALRILLEEAACDPIALAAILDGTMPAKALSVLLEAVGRGDAPVDGERLMPFYHAFYRLWEPSASESCAELGGGLAGHMARCARNTATPTDFFAALRTKQYTDARLRRAMLFGAVGVTEDDLRAMPAYTTLLAATGRGCAFLRSWRRDNRAAEDGFAVVTKPADAPVCRQSELGVRADALFTLCLPRPTGAGELMRKTAYMADRP